MLLPLCKGDLNGYRCPVCFYHPKEAAQPDSPVFEELRNASHDVAIILESVQRRIDGGQAKGASAGEMLAVSALLLAGDKQEAERMGVERAWALLCLAKQMVIKGMPEPYNGQSNRIGLTPIVNMLRGPSEIGRMMVMMSFNHLHGTGWI